MKHILQFNTLFLLIFTVLFFSSCEDNSGKLQIFTNLPSAENNSYSPLRNSNISYFNLQINTPEGVISRTSSFESNDKTIKLGDVPTGDYFSMSLSGNSINGALIAYGITNSSGTIDSLKPTKVSLNFRYPFTFIGGGEKIHLIHPFLSSDTTFPEVQLTSQYPSKIVSVVSSHNGEYLFVATESLSGSIITIKVLKTSDYKVIAEALLSYQMAPDKFILSEDDKILGMFSHDGKYVAFLDIQKFISTQDLNDSLYTMDFSSIGSPIQMVFSNPSSVVVLSSNNFSYNTCDQPPMSKISWLNIAQNINSTQGATLGLSFNTPLYTSSIDVDTNGNLYLSNPCDSKVSKVLSNQEDSSVILDTLSLSPCYLPNILSIKDDTLYVACSTENTSGSSNIPIIIKKFQLQTTSSQNDITGIYPKEYFIYHPEGIEFPSETSIIIIQTPKIVIPKSIGFTVKTKNIILYAEAFFHIKDVRLSNSVMLDELKYKSYSLLFLDSSGQINKRFRAACFLVNDETEDEIPEGGPFCSELSDAQTPSVDFIPTQISNLYGK